MKPDRNSIEERAKKCCGVCGQNWAPIIDEKTGEVVQAECHPVDTPCNRYRPVEAPVGVGAAGAAKLDEQSKARLGVADGRAMARGEGFSNG